MKRWSGALIVAILACVRILMMRNASPSLLEDSDTHVLLATITERHAPFSWFGGDWPLFNHFYRPVSTLAFEMDLRLYGHQAWGYGLTNALLCVVCTLLLCWYLRELTDRPALTAVGTAVFAIWQTRLAGTVAGCLEWLAVIVLIGGIWRHRKSIKLWLPAPLIILEVDTLLTSARSIGPATLDWLPGRTATVMTVFTLLALASYARYERLSAERKVPEITPLDPPATRNTVVTRKRRGWPAGWAVLAVVSVPLALASYEQAVMLPAVLLATAVTLRWQGYRVRWGWQALFWGALFGYLALRHVLIPSDPSRYQLQQFRSGPGVWQSIVLYVFPSLFSIPVVLGWMDQMPLILLTAEPWKVMLCFATDAAAAIEARRRWVFVVAGLGMSLIAFLPMAWLKQPDGFEHYHYWPLAMRSLLVATLGWIALELTASAWSPRTRQAPPRRDPAPGSLPRP